MSSGGPIHLDVDDYDENMRFLNDFLEEEGERAPGGGAQATPPHSQQGEQLFPGPSQPARPSGAAKIYSNSSGPSFHPDYCHPDYLEQFRAEIPHLAHLADGLLLSTRITDLLKMESNAIKRSSADKSRSLEAKLIKNQEDLLTAWLIVPSGQDNRLDSLHSARIMPAAVATAQEQWLRAREVWGLSGYAAVASFDLAAVGLDGYVTPRGWVELQDPSSSALSAKQFNLANNCSKVAADKRISLASGEDSLEIHEAMREAATLTSFQNSIRAIREAARLTMPWNASFSALEGYLISNSWLAKDIGTSQQAVKTLSDFTDHIFSLNAGRWRAKKGFLDFVELGSVWTSWFTSRGGVRGAALPSTSGGGSGSGRGSKKNSQQPQPKKKQFQGFPSGGQPPRPKPSTARPVAHAADNICKRWNQGRCPNAASGVCRTSAGLVLRHVCNYYKPDGSRCEAAHMRMNH